MYELPLRGVKGFVSYRIERSDIYSTSIASILRLLANILPNRKREDVSVMKTEVFSLSVCK